jgi:hypothetical protein
LIRGGLTRPLVKAADPAGRFVALLAMIPSYRPWRFGPVRCRCDRTGHRPRRSSAQGPGSPTALSQYRGWVFGGRTACHSSSSRASIFDRMQRRRRPTFFDASARRQVPARLAATGRVERSGQLGRDENVQRLGRRVSRRP